MTEKDKGAALATAIILAMGAVFVLGYEIGKRSVSDSCQRFGAFSEGKTTYTCQVVPPWPQN